MSGVEQEDRHLALWLIGVLDVAVPTVTFDEIMEQISRHRHEARKAALEEAAGICEQYAEVNMEICGDNIILDPVLRGEGFSEDNLKRSERHQNLSLIHSSKYHASTELAQAIRSAVRGGTT